MTTEERLLEELTIDDFRNRLTILYPKAAIDSRGNEIITYKEGPTVWAYVEVHATGMSTSSSESHITRKVLLVFRYRNDLSPEIHFRMNGEIYVPISPPTDACGRHKYTYVECVEEVKNL